MCDYLVVTGGMVSRCQGLTLAPLVMHLLWLDILRLSLFHHHSLLPVLQFARVLPVWERMVLRHLPFDRLTVYLCHRAALQRLLFDLPVERFLCPVRAILIYLGLTALVSLGPHECSSTLLV